MGKFQKGVSLFVAGWQIALPLALVELSSTPTLAAMNQSTDPNSLDASKLGTPDVDVDALCKEIVTDAASSGRGAWDGSTGHQRGSANGIQTASEGNAGNLVGITGQGVDGWDTADDQWCANHGQQTESTV